MNITHLLKANGARHAPFADKTYCGLDATATSAMWPGDKLVGTHWGVPYRIPGKWCPECRSAIAAERKRLELWINDLQADIHPSGAYIVLSKAPLPEATVLASFAAVDFLEAEARRAALGYTGFPLYVLVGS